MSKKRTAQKKSPKRRASTTAPERIDHHQLAILEYIDSGGHRGIDAVRQARAILNGVALALTTTGRSELDPDIMHGSPSGPGIFSTIFGDNLREYQKSDSRSHAHFMAELDGDKDLDLSITDPQVAFDVLVACVTDAAVLGAALAIEMMRERAR